MSERAQRLAQGILSHMIREGFSLQDTDDIISLLHDAKYRAESRIRRHVTKFWYAALSATPIGQESAIPPPVEDQGPPGWQSYIAATLPARLQALLLSPDDADLSAFDSAWCQDGDDASSLPNRYDVPLDSADDLQSQSLPPSDVVGL